MGGIAIYGYPKRRGGPTNTVAPAINAAAVIGTEITGDDGTWTGSPTLTYQWQRNTGSWADIAGATNKDYTPVDASFGYALRLGVIPNGNAAKTAYSNATDLVIEAPVQSLGSNVVLNGTFAAWTGDNPDSWTVTGESGSDPMVTQVAPGGGAGTGAARIVTTGANVYIQQDTLSSGVAVYYELGLDVNPITGSARIEAGASNPALVFSTAGNKRTISRSAGTTLRVIRLSALDMTIDNIVAQELTPNAQLTAPSANMVLDVSYTLPVSPVHGSALWAFARVSNLALGNYWRAALTYSGSQWDIVLYSVATFTPTPVITATNIGATNRFRLSMDGDSISLYTSPDNGVNWTQRDTTKTNALYNTATGVNVLWSSDFTVGQLVYAPPLP